MSPLPRKPIALDLFCGSGAVSLGLKHAGFDVVGAVDFDPSACCTYKANHSETRLIERDIRDVEPELFSDLIADRLDLLVVCAPCQPFSSQNRHKCNSDSRNNLVAESKKFISLFSPTIVFLENVPGLAASGIFEEFTSWLREECGYDVATPMRVDAANLGVPQRRTRMILIATKGVSLKIASDIKPVVRSTVSDAIRGLESPPLGRTQVGLDPLHFARRHSSLNIQRLQHIPTDGGGRESLPLALQLDCHKNARKGSFSDTYGRMRWGDVAPTLTTGCTDITRGRFAHPEENRAITLREAARLQSFPDDYIFIGNSAQIATQIGNAVPPKMMSNIAASLMSAIYSPHNEPEITS
ncbi:DNA cytosine methyltransferase [Pseudomonas sp. B21-012]|uniref:DNA cytosine methyltransferase n=1 Tax=Pseudomonas sp. B21-012 TaxID=2895472 RepID=UPI00215F68EA|nr:DNA cytosine methyltransferase [Pseudomonas sp. B21-012]UVM54082.1 DNA cytosine methyltransferase [Pseudomonas sp. B21-012]